MAECVVLGAAGQLGTELVAKLESKGLSTTAVDREDCDVTSAAAVRALLQREGPRYVFNAAAFSDVDQAESVRARAVATNGIGAGIVAAACRELDAVNVSFSSYLVFGNGHHGPIDESAPPAPLNNYGRSMLMGERLVARNCPRSFTLRCGALYSRFGTNVLRQLIQIALSGKPSITMVDDEFVSPTPATRVADAAIDLALGEHLFGTYHAAAVGGCSWHEFVTTFVQKLELDVEVVSVSSERWGAPAPRPKNAMLENAMLRAVGRDNFGDWKSELDAYLAANGEKIIWEMS